MQFVMPALRDKKQLGIIPANFDAAEPIATQNAPQKYGKWDELTAEQKH